MTIKVGDKLPDATFTVMNADGPGKTTTADVFKGKIAMLADGNGDFAKKLGLDIDLSGFGLGVRSKRYAMLVDDGVVKILNIEDSPPQHDKSSAATLCSAIDHSL